MNVLDVLLGLLWLSLGAIAIWFPKVIYWFDRQTNGRAVRWWRSAGYNITETRVERSRRVLRVAIALGATVGGVLMILDGLT